MLGGPAEPGFWFNVTHILRGILRAISVRSRLRIAGFRGSSVRISVPACHSEATPQSGSRFQGSEVPGFQGFGFRGFRGFGGSTVWCRTQSRGEAKPRPRVPASLPVRCSGIGNRDANGSRESGIGNRESGIGNRESGIGNRESGIGEWERRLLDLNVVNDVSHDKSKIKNRRSKMSLPSAESATQTLPRIPAGADGNPHPTYPGARLRLTPGSCGQRRPPRASPPQAGGME